MMLVRWLIARIQSGGVQKGSKRVASPIITMIFITHQVPQGLNVENEILIGV